MSTKFLLVTAVLFCSTEAYTIDCQMQIVSPTSFGEELYACMALVDLTGSKTLENVTQEPSFIEELNIGFPYSKFLAINDCGLTFFPKGINTYFKLLLALEVSHQEISSISGKDLEPWLQLLWLDLSFNKLSSLEGDPFSSTPNLKFLSLANNNVQQIQPDLLTPMTTLTVLLLKHNPCVKKNAETRAEVELLSSELPILCPKEKKTTTEATTTELAMGKCSCEGEIENLLNITAAFEKKLEAVEKKLREISSNP